MKQYILGCDWGTSSFRLRLIHTDTRQLIGEVTSPEGVAKTFTAWQQTGAPAGISREQFFGQHLQCEIHRLAENLRVNLTGTSIVLSGMASSSIGLAEVPYASLPFPIDGSQASVQVLPAQADFPHDIFLVGGVRAPHDVIRGEETQLIGVLALLEKQHLSVADSILIFPGTHAKHIYVKDGYITDFHTFMTGEMFSLLAHQSILKNSVESVNLRPLSADEWRAFRSGIHDANRYPLLNSLFRVRTNQLFGNLSKRQNALYLSGLLIGSELQTLVEQAGWTLILCSDAFLYALYAAGMQELNLLDRVLPTSAGLLDEATIAGQLKIRQNQGVHLSK